MAGFNPQEHLMKLKGKDYLEVKWRLVWLRDLHPDAVIETELIERKDNHAIFRAQVTLPSGASATGWGSEDTKGFVDYIEKAETKAIGRALAALGFGTQFCDDMTYSNEDVVDAPIDRQQGRPQPLRPQRIDRPSDQQRNYIIGLGKQLGMVKPDGHHDEAALDDALRKAVGAPLADLTKTQATEAIERMKAKIDSLPKPTGNADRMQA